MNDIQISKLDDIRLTEHFKLSEFLRSSTATARHIDNLPATPRACLEVISNLQTLCREVLEPLRAFINSSDSPSPFSFRRGAGGEASIGGAGGEAPILITSGYRCAALNQAVGGSKTSQHMTGEAADIHINSVEEGRLWFAWIMDHCRFDQLIWESDRQGTSWIHVSCRRDLGTNRQQVKSLRKS